MNSTSRLSVLIAAVAIVAIIAGTWFVGIAPRLTEIGAAETQRATVEAQNAAHEATIRELEALEEQRESLEAELADLRVSMPGDDGVTDLMREIDGIAAASGTVITLLGFEGPTRYVQTEAVPTDPEVVAALPSVTPDNLLTISVSLEIVGDQAQVIDAIWRMQAAKRFLLVHDVDFEVGLAATITGQVFVLRDAADVPPPVPAEGEAVPEAQPLE